MELFLFYLLGGISVGSALAMVTNVRNTVAAAMSLVITMIALAGVYVLLDAQLVAVIQIMVYAGAIVVLFLFVVMLLNLRRDEFPPVRQRVMRVLGVGVAGVVLFQFLQALPGSLPEPAVVPESFGGYQHAGWALYTDFVLPFEVTSLLLLAAIVSAVMLAKRRLD
ncbi:MAG: NADH-quinone oxidoreductase subunit J [Myxococcota bacterium]